MRTLAAISLSFAAAVFAAVLLPWSGWTWWAAIVCGAMGLAAVLLRRRLPDKLRLRAAVILFSLCGGLLYFGGYQALVQQPVLERCGREAEFSAVAADFGQLTEQGGRVTVYPEGLRGVKAVCYGGQELAQLEPGQRITGYARWQDAGRIHENDVTTFTSRGVFALLYVQGDVTEEAGSAGSLRWLPQRTARALREKIAAIWDDDDHRRLRHGGADRRPGRPVRGGRDGHVPGRTFPPVRRVRPALRVSGEPAGPAAGQQAAAVRRGIHGSAGVLYAGGGPVAVSGAGMHHAGLRAGGAPVQAGQRRPYQPGERRCW